MKYFFIAISIFYLTATSYSQETLLPYLQTKTLPTVRLLSVDSTGWELKSKIDTKKSVMLYYFSPECDHCKRETEELIKNIDKFKNIQIIMATPLPLSEMKEFAETYHLLNYTNILIGRDYTYSIMIFYGIKNLPYHAFYDKKKKLLGTFEGSMSPEKIFQHFK